MTSPNTFAINQGWRILLRDLGINPGNVLRRAGVPGDLFGREGATLNTEEYFRLWRAVEEEADDPTLPIRIGQAISVEAFDPPIFAALCSPDLNTALGRISQYKKLVCPMALHVARGAEATTLEIKWLTAAVTPPVSLAATELVFFVQLARLATRVKIQPLKVTTPRPPAPAGDYEEYFGVTIQRGGRSFQSVINQTREELARHYLRNSKMSGAEISFLLGFADPNSFFRAFQSWTGQTPERMRTLSRGLAAG